MVIVFDNFIILFLIGHGLWNSLVLMIRTFRRVFFIDLDCLKDLLKKAEFLRFRYTSNPSKINTIPKTGGNTVNISITHFHTRFMLSMLVE